MADQIQSVISSVGKWVPSFFPRKEIEKVIVREVQMIGIPPTARIFFRVAGISGAIAVALGAYGSHVFRQKEVDQRLKEQPTNQTDISHYRRETFEIANKYHFIHTLALLAIPLTRKPLLSGSLMTAGLVLFCGSCYYHAITNNMSIRKVTPYGGFLLIFAWASMAL
ncbi:transmembrane protein 256 homolog isoform X1 [Physella acuta]|uniref:transmembrane protein 256 homolog isoform X1 n=1 Tax=Physella acuta TaxID=109671 RepID=UPI0027DE5BB5|nr:transmembrane protein 256 homolog isoform X1 [Physella acuta]